MESLTDQDEQWDVWCDQYHLHSLRASEAYFYKQRWWFPEPGRDGITINQFAASKAAIIKNIKWYDLYMTGGRVLENVVCRYVGQDDDDTDGCLRGYVSYDTAKVMLQMLSIPKELPLHTRKP